MGTILALCAVVLTRARSSEPPSITHTYATGAAQWSTAQLADGTIVTLAPLTTLTVSFDAGRGTNTLVDGSVLFQVRAHGSSAGSSPFVVRAGAAEARVLGTTFLVRKYATDRLATVVVAQGRVAVRSRSFDGTMTRATTLSARMRSLVSDSGTMRIDDTLPAGDLSALMQGRLVFRNTPLRDVVAELSRAYGVTIRLADSTTAPYPFTTVVSVQTRSLDDVLEPLLATLGAHAQRRGQIITIVPGRRASARPLAHPIPPHASEAQYGR
jgi:transmembrane sensor